MKIITILIILVLLSSCAKSNRAKLNVKINLGAISALYSGGIFINSINTANGSNTIFKADDTGVVSIPFGTYTFMVVAFSGPGPKEGTMVCGSTPEVILNTTESTVTVNVNNNNCADQNYNNFINSIFNTNIALWDTAKFDNSQWGP